MAAKPKKVTSKAPELAELGPEDFALKYAPHCTEQLRQQWSAQAMIAIVSDGISMTVVDAMIDSLIEMNKADADL